MVQVLESGGGDGLPCQFATARDGVVALVELTGDIDLVCVAAIRSQLRAVFVEGGEELRIDLSGATFIDSTGLGALVWAWKQARMFRMRFVLVKPSAEVARILTMSGLDRVLDIE